jgi:hypothetical protein
MQRGSYYLPGNAAFMKHVLYRLTVAGGNWIRYGTEKREGHHT